MKSKYKWLAIVGVSIIAPTLVGLFLIHSELPADTRIIGSFCVGVLYMLTVDTILLKEAINATKPVIKKVEGDPTDPHWTGPIYEYYVPELGKARLVGPVLLAITGDPPRTVRIQLSKESEEELEQMRSELNLSEISDNITCMKPLDEFLELERENQEKK